jgi:hypothetical protein
MDRPAPGGLEQGLEQREGADGTCLVALRPGVRPPSTVQCNASTVLTGRPCSGWAEGPKKGGHAVEKGWRMIVFNFSGALRRGSLK